MTAYFDFCRNFIFTWYGGIITGVLVYALILHRPVMKLLKKAAPKTDAAAETKTKDV